MGTEPRLELPMIHRVDHIAVAVRSLSERLRFWADALGLEVGGVHTVESEGVKVAFLPAGSTRVELLEPLGPDTPVGKFLAERGEGLHHLTLEVDDLDQMLERLEDKGVQVLGDSKARTGSEGQRVAFLHPRSAGGVLVELTERGGIPQVADIRPGQAVLLYLRDPQEKLWGVLRRLDGAGVVLEGIDISSFDDWAAQIERGEESVAGPSVLFMPTMRLEKILLDRSSGHLPSLAERFYRRVGRSIQEVLDASSGSASHGD